ncbi:MAG: histidinol phosphate phosphatase domain-containing protein [Thermodesulfobacteriota bacterium]
MIDLHTHTIFSDGELIPAELIQRAEVKGLIGIALTDHADMSNLDLILPRVRRACLDLNRQHRVQALPGVELTHVPPALIPDLIQQARDLGAAIVVVHGETIVEPVWPGTNLAAIQGGADLLAHPGLLTPQEAGLAAEKGVLLELSARKGHCLGNGRVAALARAAGASLVVNTDSHAPGDLIDHAQAERVALGAGLNPAEAAAVFAAAQAFLGRALETLS